MAKKTAISNEYVITINEDGSIEVFRQFDNVKASLREIANQQGFAYSPEWTTRQFGQKIIKANGGVDDVEIGNYYVRRLPSGTIESYRTYDNVKGALREVAGKIGFTYDPNWTTRQFGNKLVNFLNGNSPSESEDDITPEPEVTAPEPEDSTQKSEADSSEREFVAPMEQKVKKGGCLGMLLVLLLPVTLMCYLLGLIIR